MGKIHHLSEKIIAQIAAGEVIERPVYAVKELIENAIDAQADNIIIQIEDGGLKRITVVDSGEGMSEDDLVACFKAHTTSKLVLQDQLQAITTLGFRGEALSSIAAISNLIIKSKQSNTSEGRSVEVRAGRLESIATVGMPQGTVVTVNNLFYSTPARKKFFTSTRTEFRHIVDLVTHYALGYPKIRFSLSHNNKTIFDLSKTTDLLERIRKLLGVHFYESLLPVNYKDSYLQISGFITKPQITSTGTRKQFIFVNNRSIINKYISQVVKEVYGTLLEPHAYPVFLLYLHIPFDLVDVNVHPRKEEVRFVDSQMLIEAVRQAVSQTLLEHNLTFHNNSWKRSAFSGEIPENIHSSRFGHTNSFAGELLKEKSLPWASRNITTILSSADISQVHNLYIITQTKHGLVLIDQHAAHERILYEEFTQEFRKQRKRGSYALPRSLSFEVTLSESELLKEHLSLFSRLGYEIEYFKGTSFFLSSVPVLFKDRNNLKIITEILDDIAQEKGPREVDIASAKMIAYLACRSAVKAGERLTKKQCKEILEKLEKTPNSTTCPHGRPVKVEIDLQKIHTLFKR